MSELDSPTDGPLLGRANSEFLPPQPDVVRSTQQLQSSGRAEAVYRKPLTSLSSEPGYHEIFLASHNDRRHVYGSLSDDNGSVVNSIGEQSVAFSESESDVTSGGENVGLLYSGRKRKTVAKKTKKGERQPLLHRINPTMERPAAVGRATSDDDRHALELYGNYNFFCEDPEFTAAVQDSIHAIDAGVFPERIAQGSSGSYFVTNFNRDKIGVFKPKNEEPYGNLNPKWLKWMHRVACPCCFGRSCLVPNQVGVFLVFLLFR
uniref:Phosphatidylinositol 4-kinase type 2 n=1 Tax=Plectus sambesii TaxID=2011161 RepID=A0A914VJG2_9BILA